jgi:uncharacterized UBP type Zn finger protein
MDMQRLDTTTCTHAPETIAEPRSGTCEECGSDVNLRMCTSCGHVGCCESQLAHNTQHAEASGHQVIMSMPLSERSFTWCYACGRYLP